MSDAVLDNPVHASVRTERGGPHAHLARHRGGAAAFDADVAPFHAVPDEPTAADFADLAALLGAGGHTTLVGLREAPPAAWQPTYRLPGLQLVAPWLPGAAPADLPAPDPEAVVLGPADVPAMVALVAATQPGPFFARTHLLGSYVGFRDAEGRLVAMAGERLQPAGWVEISAVCTAVEARGRGYAGRLVTTVAAGALASGRRPLLHALADNTGAIRLYESLGFTVRREIDFAGWQLPR